MVMLRVINRADFQKESELIEACRKGDRAALETVFVTHSPYIERVLTRIAGFDEDIEDLLQMTFVAAIRAFPRFRGEASVKTWLTRIAVRIAQEQIRKPERRRRVAYEARTDRSFDDTTTGPDGSVDVKRKLKRIYYHLNAIAPKKRTAFLLHVIEGYPIDEVAALVGASLTATKSRVFWARRELLARVNKDPILSESEREVVKP
jgi:RNA polymerase sigma-70 factor (ECF subfamily)